MLKSMEMPAFFWAEAVRTAVYVLNHAPTRSLEGVTPYEAWHGRKPTVHHLRMFGCTVHVKRVGPGITKLSDRSTPMVFVGYEEGSKAYRVYNLASKKVQVTRDVVFEESRPWAWRVPGAAEVYIAPSTFTVVYTTDQGVHEVDRGTPALPGTPHSPTTPSTPASSGSPSGMSTPGGSALASPSSSGTPRLGEARSGHHGPSQRRLMGS